MIIGVAIKLEGVVHQLPKPGRHFDLITKLFLDDGIVDTLEGVEGFVTDAGEFLDRTAAHDYAIAHGQVHRSQMCSSRRLISQDLW